MEQYKGVHMNSPLNPILNQFNLNPRTFRTILYTILYSFLLLHFPSGSFSVGFPSKMLNAFLKSHICPVSPSHLFVFDHPST
jgi:hypothetical protein